MLIDVKGSSNKLQIKNNVKLPMLYNMKMQGPIKAYTKKDQEPVISTIEKFWGVIGDN